MALCSPSLPGGAPNRRVQPGIAALARALGTALILAWWLGGCAAPQEGPHREPPTTARGHLSAPPIVTVAAWGGTAEGAAPQPKQSIHKITLHHQGETWKEGADVAAYLRRLQQWSRLTKRWADIPYHYVIAPDGQIYAARPETLSGDTNTDYNPQGHALVMLIGNFEEVQPTAAQLESTVSLVAWLAGTYKLSVSAIASHKDYSAQTVCPGKNFYAYLESGWVQRAVNARLGRDHPN